MDTLTSTSDWAVNAAVVVGTIAFAISGASVARRSRMDWFGAVVLAVLVAIGGGTLRDLLLGRFPVSWIEDPWPVALAAGTGAAVIGIGARIEVDPGSWQTVVVADAVGLAVFTMLGTDVALDAGTTSWVAVILGVVTGIGGGILRDVLANEKPLVLTGEIYALAAIAGAAMHVAFLKSGADPLLTWWIPVLAVFGLRLLAIRRGWSLPTVDRGAG